MVNGLGLAWSPVKKEMMKKAVVTIFLYFVIFLSIFLNKHF
jgi:hypothetical protein